jgi:hypothetical protein
MFVLTQQRTQGPGQGGTARGGHNGRMSDDNQILIPASFIALFVPPGRHKATASRDLIAERHEFCEDLAQMLVETAQTQCWSLGITDDDVLERVALGLGEIDLSDAERGWVLGRLRELLAG